MYKDICGGGKGGGSAYDPQIAKASASAAETASKAEQFSEDYYTNVITPLLQQQSAASADSQAKLGKLYDINADQMQVANDRYQQYGIPAENRYYDMVSRYSEPEEMQRQAEAAKGDFATAQQSEQGALNRQMSALGVDPTSPAAISAASDRAVMGAAMQANAMNRARNAARTLGMQLTSDAANFGRGGQSGILQFGAGAQGNATGAFGIANAALGTGMQAGSGVTQGYQTALSGYNGIMDSYSRLGAADIQAQAQQGGVGSVLGQLGGIALSTGLKAGWMSDIRAKENIAHVDTLPSGVKVYSFTYKPEFAERWGRGPQVGVIAQEVARVIPEAVAIDDDGYMTVDYGKVH
jgi:hypothetical protein